MIGTAYLDASGAMRLLLTRRVGYRRAQQVWEEADDLVAATLTYAEVCAALAAARRNQELTESAFGRALRSWDGLWAQVAPVALDEPLAKTAGVLARQHTLSGADAVHLAAARATGSDLLLSADRILCAAAQRCGMATVEFNDPA